MLSFIIPSDTKVIVSVSEGMQKSICITVRDNGVGIKEAEQAELFTRYYRGTIQKKKPEGSGLGLAIAKQIVVLHGGHIAVKSKSGEAQNFQSCSQQIKVKLRYEKSDLRWVIYDITIDHPFLIWD